MATSRITNTIKGPTGTAIAGVPVTVVLMPSAGFRESDFTEVARLTTTTTDSSGFWQLDLERNSNITPSNSWYEVIEAVPAAAGGRRVWQIAVGDSDQSLLASLVTPAQQQPTVVPAGTVYLDQAAADARYQALGGLSSSAPSNVEDNENIPGSGGVSSSASRADHTHQFLAASPVTIGLTGSTAIGTEGSYARATHVHSYNPPACRVTLGANLSLPNGTVTTATWATEQFDTDNMHSTSVNTARLTVQTAGLYVVTLGGLIQSAADYTRFMGRILLNGSTEIGRQTDMGTYSGGESNGVSLSALWKASADDYFTGQFLQNNSAAAARVIADAHYSFFSAVWIGVG